MDGTADGKAGIGIDGGCAPLATVRRTVVMGLCGWLMEGGRD
jgi:hypothetical protein